MYFLSVIVFNIINFYYCDYLFVLLLYDIGIANVLLTTNFMQITITNYRYITTYTFLSYSISFFTYCFYSFFLMSYSITIIYIYTYHFCILQVTPQLMLGYSFFDCLPLITAFNLFILYLKNNQKSYILTLTGE
jgi:hypothetical protein